MSSRSVKLLEQMERSHANWKRQDLITMMRGFGFTLRRGSKHDILTHEEYRWLRLTLPRRRQVKGNYVLDAIKLVDISLDLKHHPR